MEWHLTHLIIEGEALKHALVHECLLLRSIWDQFGSLGFKLTLQNKIIMTAVVFFLSVSLVIGICVD